MMQSQQRDAIISIMSQFLMISVEFGEQLRVALDMKKNFLKESGASAEDIEQVCKTEEELISKWNIICTSIVLRAAPQSYVKYFQNTNFKDFKTKE